MTRTYILLAAFLAALGATSVFFDGGNQVSAENTQEQRLESTRLRRMEFGERLFVWEHELETGTRSFRDVVESIHEYAQTNYPEYLQLIASVEPGASAQ